MPDIIEKSLKKILEGLPLESPEADLCDFTIAQQNEVMESQGVTPTVKSNFVPVLEETITYIVACVLINDNDEVLMMQEAKAHCSGKWYLPAGRMERGENICEAAQREVLEETGLTVDLTTLLMVETAHGSWIRFVLTGVVTGGVLKTPDKADRESLQAKWIQNINDYPLRSTDITHLIERARMHKIAQRTGDRTWHSNILPGLYNHPRILLRLVICARRRSTNRLHIVVNELTTRHLPTCEVHPARSVHSSLRKFMIELFGAEVAPHKPHGILSVEHNAKGGNSDGSCLTVLVAFRPPLEDCPIVAKCNWTEISKELEERLLKKIVNKNAVIPLHVIR